jgi:hypothetical protein
MYILGFFVVVDWECVDKGRKNEDMCVCVCVRGARELVSKLDSWASIDRYIYI